ncbi:ubiquinol-cytochrome C chaperone family protein [Thalassobaculum sp.]|uniref:ubiquinol-cytochrome C chaperone family protein n=1 Tax=Thalassobaculum sp. TaxID=2022740 RepID=UPI0032EE94EA
MVFERFFKGRRHRRAVEAVYDAIVEQARHPVFYTDYGVADGFEERFELLVLHVHLVVRRLAADGRPGLAQELFDTLFLDMDRTLRLIGVGDMSVGKRVKDMSRAYYGRTTAYESALSDASTDALAAALARNVFSDPEPTDRGRRLARYVRAAVEGLKAQSLDDISAGSVGFPGPETTP